MIKATSFIGVPLCVGVVVIGMTGWTREPAGYPPTQDRQSPRVAGAAIAELREIGKRLAAAVLAHDTETILKYDRPDLRSTDTQELSNRKSDLYCYLFDAKCNANARASIRDILTSAVRLEVEIQLLESGQGPPTALVLFFDAARTTRERLRSASELCELSSKQQIASWTFKFESSRWISMHPPFDGETDTLCSPA